MEEATTVVSSFELQALRAIARAVGRTYASCNIDGLLPDEESIVAHLESLVYLMPQDKEEGIAGNATHNCEEDLQRTHEQNLATAASLQGTSITDLTNLEIAQVFMLMCHGYLTPFESGSVGQAVEDIKPLE